MSLIQNEVTTPDPQTPRKAAAEAGVEVALECIEEAQQLIGRAAQALCSVSGLGREWRRLGALYDQAKRIWHDVRGRSDSLSRQGRLLLDHEPDPHQAQWTPLRRGR